MNADESNRMRYAAERNRYASQFSQLRQEHNRKTNTIQRMKVKTYEDGKCKTCSNRKVVVEIANLKIKYCSRCIPNELLRSIIIQ